MPEANAKRQGEVFEKGAVEVANGGDAVGSTTHANKTAAALGHLGAVVADDPSHEDFAAGRDQLGEIFLRHVDGKVAKVDGEVVELPVDDATDVHAELREAFDGANGGGRGVEDERDVADAALPDRQARQLLLAHLLPRRDERVVSVRLVRDPRVAERDLQDLQPTKKKKNATLRSHDTK